MKTVVLEGKSVGQDMSWDFLGEFGEYKVFDALQQEDVCAAIKDADIIIPNKLIIDEAVLAGSKVSLVCEAATGYNNIDTVYCKKNGIAVTNVSGYSTDSVAQHTVALLLSVYEKLSYYNSFVKSGEYSKSNSFSHLDKRFHEIKGKTWGIVGLGAIGRKTAELATAFGAKVIYYSASGNTYNAPYEAVNFDTLLKTSDIISIHCPLTEKTRYLFDENAFSMMKTSATLINVARGPIVSDKALADAILNNKIMAAGLDVFELEPILPDNPLAKIKDDSRLILTPHIGWGAVEARSRLLKEISLNIKAFINGEIRNRIV